MPKLWSFLHSAQELCSAKTAFAVLQPMSGRAISVETWRLNP